MHKRIDIPLTVLTNIVMKLVAFVIVIITSKYYGPVGRGYIAACIAIATLTDSFGGFSISRILIYLITKSDLAPIEFYKKHLVSILLTFFLLVILSAGVLSVVFIAKPQLFGTIPPLYFFIFMLMLPYFFWTNYGKSIFSTIYKIMYQNKIILMVRSLFLILTILAVALFRVNLGTFVVIMFLCNWLEFFSQIGYLVKKIKPSFHIEFSFLKVLFSASAKLHFNTVGSYFAYAANLLLVNYFLGPYYVGQFQLAMQFISAIMIVPYVMSLFLGSSIANLGKDKIWQDYKRQVIQTMLFILLLLVLAYFLYPTAISILVGDKFLDSIPVFNWMLLTALGNSLFVLMGPQWVSRGYFKGMTAITVTSAISGFAFGLLFIPSLGVVGAACATVVSYGLMFVCNIGFFIFLDKKSFRVKEGAVVSEI